MCVCVSVCACVCMMVCGWVFRLPFPHQSIVVSPYMCSGSSCILYGLCVVSSFLPGFSWARVSFRVLCLLRRLAFSPVCMLVRARVCVGRRPRTRMRARARARRLPSVAGRQPLSLRRCGRRSSGRGSSGISRSGGSGGGHLFPDGCPPLYPGTFG